MFTGHIISLFPIFLGVGPFDRTIHNGKRWSASQAYLRPALDRKNLTAQDRAMTLKVIFEGDKAVGVEYMHKNQIKRAKANKEVILSGTLLSSHTKIHKFWF